MNKTIKLSNDVDLQKMDLKGIGPEEEGSVFARLKIKLTMDFHQMSDVFGDTLAIMAFTKNGTNFLMSQMKLNIKFDAHTIRIDHFPSALVGLAIDSIAPAKEGNFVDLYLFCGLNIKDDKVLLHLANRLDNTIFIEIRSKQLEFDFDDENKEESQSIDDTETEEPDNTTA